MNHESNMDLEPDERLYESAAHILQDEETGGLGAERNQNYQGRSRILENINNFLNIRTVRKAIPFLLTIAATLSVAYLCFFVYFLSHNSSVQKAKNIRPFTASPFMELTSNLDSKDQSSNWSNPTSSQPISDNILPFSSPLDSPCDPDWTPYNQEYCFQIFHDKGLKTYSEAKEICDQFGATLVDINNSHKQNFVAHFLFGTHNHVDNVWLGGRYVTPTNKYQWESGSGLLFTNWAILNPKNRTNACVQMHSDGKWADEPCNKKNLVVCQKSTTLTVAHLQELMFGLRQNMFPIGFIYAQLPKQQAPTEMWPWMSWKDASSEYANLFFRVDDGTDDDFGTIQTESSPRLTRIQYEYNNNHAPSNLNMQETHDNTIKTGGNDYSGSKLRFFWSGETVRPQNMAFRVWKRIG